MKKEEVYLIGDEGMQRRSLQGYIESEGFKCHVFSSCRRFLDIYSSLLRGCIVLDYENFDMDAVELLEKMNRDQSSLKTIVLSGHETVSQVVEVMKFGVFDLIQKPFSDNTLGDSIRSALSASNDSREKGSVDSEGG